MFVEFTIRAKNADGVLHLEKWTVTFDENWNLIDGGPTP
jgi:hypothetical protein